MDTIASTAAPDVTAPIRDGAPSSPIVLVGMGALGRRLAVQLQARGVRILAAVDHDANLAGRTLDDVLGESDGEGPRILASIAELGWADSGVEAIAVVAVADRLSEAVPIILECVRRGMHVVTTAGQMIDPSVFDPQAAERIDEEARERGVAVLGTGFGDFYRVNALRLITGPAFEITAVRHRSVATPGRDGPGALRSAGARLTAAEFAEFAAAQAEGGRPLYEAFLRRAVSAIGWEIREVSSRFDPVYPEGLTSRDALTSGSRCVTSIRTDVGIEVTGEADFRLLEDGEEEYVEWEVDGLPGSRVRFSGLGSAEACAASVFRRLNDVVTASPGLHTVDDFAPLSFR